MQDSVKKAFLSGFSKPPAWRKLSAEENILGFAFSLA